MFFWGWDSIGKTLHLVTFLAQLIGVVLKEFFLQFLDGFLAMKPLFGASWRAHNRGGVEIFLAMNRRYEGTFFSPLHLWNRTVKILYYVDFWGSLDS